MSDQKGTGEFSKVRKLISVLEKCNGRSKIGGSEALISPRAAKVLAAVGLVFLIAALAATAYFAEPLISPYISLKDFTKVLMMILLLLSLVLSVKNIVTVLYTADDLPVLLPMPFSAGQIVTAKLTVTLKFPVVLSVILINASFFGFGLRAGMGAAFYIGTVLSSVLIPVTGLAIAALLTVVIFKCCGFIRNRDIMVAIGGILTLVLTVGYVIVSSILNSNDSADAALSALVCGHFRVLPEHRVYEWLYVRRKYHRTVHQSRHYRCSDRFSLACHQAVLSVHSALHAKYGLRKKACRKKHAFRSEEARRSESANLL